MNIRTITTNSDVETIMLQCIDKFNGFLLKKDVAKMPLGLFYGKTGLVVYFYHQARLTKNRKFERFAGKLLDSVLFLIYKGILIILLTF